MFFLLKQDYSTVIMFMFDTVGSERHFEPYHKSRIPKEMHPVVKKHLMRSERTEERRVHFVGDKDGPYNMYLFAVMSTKCFQSFFN